MDCHFQNPAHLEIICNYVISPFKEKMTTKFSSILKKQFRGISHLNILYISWDTSREFVHQDQDHSVYYFRSLKAMNLLTKYHLTCLMGNNISRLINIFGIFLILFNKKLILSLNILSNPKSTPVIWVMW